MFLQLLCHLSQGCSKVLWGVIGAAVVITLITIPAVYFSKSDRAKRPFTLENYFNDTIRWKSYNLYWISDKEYLHKTRDGNVFLHNAETNEESLYLSNSTFAQVDATDYMLSGDYKYIAFESNFTKAYVSDFNVFFKSNVTAEAVQVTHNGKKNEILNGVPDWVYEEEVFASNGAIWWSSTGKFLAYAEFNDTDVHKVEFSWYGTEQYPQTVAVPYPKAGSPLTKVKLFVVDTTDPSRPTQVVAPASVASGDHMLCSVTWVTDERVAVQWVTRKQNYVVVQIYDFDGSSWQEIQVAVSQDGMGRPCKFPKSLPPLIYVPLPLFFADDKLSFYKVMSDTQGYKHIHYVKDGKATPITSGKWEVIYISKLTKDAIYFVSNEYQGIPGKRDLYKVLIGSSPSAPQCLTCGLRKDRCQYNSAYFSFDASYYRMDCYGPGLPHYTLIDNRGSGAELAVLEDNKELENILSEFQMPTMQYGTLKVAGYDLWYQMMLPPNFKKSKKYPLLINVYGGPCSQQVDYRFKLNWGTYLSSSHGIIIASFDGRGSGYQGDEIMHAIYRRLGTFEVEDQITAVRKFIDMGFIDKDKIAIWGWSYGGYVTSMALGAGTGLFKCGIAVAPVAKWEYYDAVYTERYMGKPTENSDSYNNSTVTARAKNFKTVDYLLVHGTADDNVHFQQAAQISKALVNEQVDFESMWYTDRDHSLRGSAFHHTYTLMSHFLQKCLLNPK
uniref:Fibroblast activation protein, alpha n=1 Tax=Sander lucioperca TaxID=283035 RepID=A0A8C9ZJE2_SANLU